MATSRDLLVVLVGATEPFRHVDRVEKKHQRQGVLDRRLPVRQSQALSPLCLQSSIRFSPANTQPLAGKSGIDINWCSAVVRSTHTSLVSGLDWTVAVWC